MDKNEWYHALIAEEKANQSQFENRALLTYLSWYLDEIGQRIAQKNQQIDGELWNHEQW